MDITTQVKNQHLLWRAGFGPMAEDMEQIRRATPKTLVGVLLKTSAGKPEYIDVADNALKGLMMGVGDTVRMQKNELSEEQKKQMRKQSQQDIRSLNLAWLNEMVNSDAQLREKMSLFWHGHFASRNLNIFYQQLLLDVLRNHALGSFADLLREVSKSAAMINFLNNNQNKKDHPNENFAREVMELFTLGRGHYTEQDVKEAARAFTGWGATVQGEFVFRQNQHDSGTKTFLGKSGDFDGDDILNILLEQKQTARFITSKVYRYFVNEQIDPLKLDWLADRFYQSHYDIRDLMTSIFTSDWFYDAANIGCRIKSPVELLVGMRRMLPMQFDHEESQLMIQKLLGQVLFYPPNVAGWPGGTNWIDSSTLMFRLRIPQIIYAAEELQLQPKTDDDQAMGMKETDDGIAGRNGNPRRAKQSLSAVIDWQAYAKQFAALKQEQLSQAIASALLQTDPGVSTQLLGQYTDQSNRETLIRTMTIALMSTPQYQLC